MSVKICSSVTIDHIPSDLDIVDRTINGKCSGCAGCCTPFLPISKSNERDIRRYLKEHPEITNQYPSDLDQETLIAVCPFNDRETHKCLIYPVRPFVCRNFICNKPIDVIRKERVMYARVAKYNGFFFGSPTASMQYLFFNDYNFDFSWRHLTLMQEFNSSYELRKARNNKPFTFEEEQEVLPLLVDSLIKKGGD